MAVAASKGASVRAGRAGSKGATGNNCPRKARCGHCLAGNIRVAIARQGIAPGVHAAVAAVRCRRCCLRARQVEDPESSALSYLVDTNALSELRRRSPNPRVAEWFSSRPSTTLYISVLTLGEIRRGIETIADRERRLRLVDWLETALPAFFVGRILPIDAAVADRWGRLIAAARRPLPAVDRLLAATAIEHDLELVTRNARDFDGIPLSVIDPWSAS